MRQLSARDAGFLYSDTSHANANITLVQIYDQSTAPGGKVRFKSILAHIESRLGELPMFRSKLQRVPLDLDHPYWVDDPNFDLEYHVRHIALPKPATGASCASRPRASTRERSTATARCGRSTWSRAWTACSSFRQAASRC